MRKKDEIPTLALFHTVPSGLDAPALSAHRSLDTGGMPHVFGRESITASVAHCMALRSERRREKLSRTTSSSAATSSPGCHNKRLPGPWRGLSPRQRTANLCLTCNRCATAVRHCSNPRRETPRFDVQPSSRDAAVTRRHVLQASRRCRGASRRASDGPIGARSERGIMTYLPLISAPVAIQPSVLPAARLSDAPPLETEGR